MKILKEHNKGYQIIERYNKPYIRFWGGREEEMICEFPITHEQAKRAIDNPYLIEQYIAQKKEEVEWTAETFYKIGIIEYIINVLDKNQEQANKSYEKICKYKDIRNEFYKYIMSENFPTDNIIKVEEYTAEELCKTIDEECH